MLKYSISIAFSVGLLVVASQWVLGQSGAGRPPQAISGQGALPAVQPQSPNGFSDIVHVSKNRDGHFYTDLRINDRLIPVLVDTGATMLVLQESAAQNAGLYPAPVDFKHPVQTANGQAMAALVRARQVELGMLIVQEVDVMVLPDSILSTNLLGMDVLSKMGTVSFNMDGLQIERMR